MKHTFGHRYDKSQLHAEQGDSVLSMRKNQPPSGTSSGSPHHTGSAPSSPSPLPWLCESPVSGAKATHEACCVREPKQHCMVVVREEADLDGLSEEAFS